MGSRTPLFAWHEAQGARIVDFGGWDMPVAYSSIIEEHQATRQAAGLFDICHMGRLCFDGPDATRFLDHVLTNRVDNLEPGQARYNLVLNEAGCVLDDVLVTRLRDYHLLVVNASNREKLLAWFGRHLADFDARMTDRTIEWGMVACQGPRALETAQRLVEAKLSDVRYYRAVETTCDGAYAIASRSGYTGEDGVEFVVPADRIVGLWTRLVESGASAGVKPAGLGARDTLRLEAGMPLYGHELSETLDPIQTGLGWAVKADRKDFIGKDALLERDPGRPVRVGLKLDGKRIAREGFPILQGESTVGVISSGTFGPTVDASIAMGYVAPEAASVGQSLAVLVRDRPVSATVVALPFYSREKKI